MTTHVVATMLKNKIPAVIFLFFMTSLLYAKTAEAIFAGGNFWRMEAEFSKLPGVLETVSGFDGGSTINPTDEDVSAGRTDYAQAVRVIYNPDVTTYQQIIDYFWQNIDPTVDKAQFCDSGSQYRTAIFYLDTQQKKIALASKRKIEKKFDKIYTQISPSTQFYAADGSQQGYYQNHPLRYKYYLYRCGHKTRLAKIWQQI